MFNLSSLRMANDPALAVELGLCARKRVSNIEGCAVACGDSASRFRPPKAPQPDEQ
jgi:hypothetical protein